MRRLLFFLSALIFFVLIFSPSSKALAAVPSQPTGLSASTFCQGTVSGMSFLWNSVSGSGITYNVHWKLSTATAWNSNHSTSANSFSYPPSSCTSGPGGCSFSYGASVDWGVNACNSSGCSAYTTGLITSKTCGPTPTITPTPTLPPGATPTPTTPQSTGPNGCPVCPANYIWDPTAKQCSQPGQVDSLGHTLPPLTSSPTYVTCPNTQVCYQGCGCNSPCNKNTQFQRGVLPCGTSGANCPTAIGSINANIGGLVQKLFSIMLAVGGGLAVILIIVSGYRLVTSQGNPETTQKAREQLTAAIVGLLFIIFSLVILQTIGFDILHIPGFNP